MWEDLILFIAIGFAAQIVDGAVGMAYGLTASSVLLSTGVPPSVTSASVHAAEVFTTGISGASHWKVGNVRWNLVWRLALPGMVGGAIGAYVLEGAIELEIDGQAPVVYEAGQTYHIPPGVVHAARNPSDSVTTKILVFWTAEAGQPLTTPAP